MTVFSYLHTKCSVLPVIADKHLSLIDTPAPMGPAVRSGSREFPISRLNSDAMHSCQP